LTLFLLDAATLLPLYPTADPTGSDALLAIDLGGGSVRAAVYEPTATGGAILRVGNAVPEPPIWSLWLLGALVGGRFLRTVPRRS
jgi:hypothetical protein